MQKGGKLDVIREPRLRNILALKSEASTINKLILLNVELFVKKRIRQHVLYKIY